MRRTALAAAFCLAAACGTDPAAPPSDTSTLMAPASGTLGNLVACVGKTAVPAEPKMAPVYNCRDSVFVNGADTQLRNAITPAVNRWRTGVLGQNNLPFFKSTGPGNRTVPVNWAGPTNGTWICGDGLKSQQSITITRSTSSSSCAGEFSTNPVGMNRLTDLIAHELSHTFGFGHFSQLGSVPAMDHCASSLPDEGGLNSGLCLAEIIKIQYHYGMRTDIDVSKPILTSLFTAGPSTVVDGSTVTWNVDELIFDGGAGPANPATVGLLWSSANTNIATTSGSTSLSNVITGVNPGTTNIRVKLNDSRFQTENPGDQTERPITVTAPASPPPPPSNLTASQIAFTSATVGWTNGTTGATTTVQYRVSGTTTWTTFGTTGVNAVTQPITGLTGNTEYDVRVYHNKDGFESTKLVKTQLFKTLNPSVLPPITNFIVLSCRQEVTNGKTFNYFTMGWTSAPSPPGSSFQIASNSANNPATGSIMITVPGSQRQAEVGAWNSSPILLNRWFWVRYVGGPWVALNPSPMAANQCLQ